MRILILGGSGMLGHRLWIRLQGSYETWVTVRGKLSPFKDRREFPREFIFPSVDALVFDEITSAISEIRPDVVINCVGLIKQLPKAKDPLSAISVNALLPHRLALICQAAHIRLIHISTDCVFSGSVGNYTEEAVSDATDLYGRTKFLGEVGYPHAVTLRTSIIGRELKSRLGLIEWFLAQEGEIKGFRKAIYSGFTTDELARIIRDFVITDTDLTGIYHVSSDPISKYDLLMLAKREFDKEILIHPDDDFIIDRSLDSSKFKSNTGYSSPTWPEMIRELAASSDLYDSL